MSASVSQTCPIKIYVPRWHWKIPHLYKQFQQQHELWLTSYLLWVFSSDLCVTSFPWEILLRCPAWTVGSGWDRSIGLSFISLFWQERWQRAILLYHLLLCEHSSTSTADFIPGSAVLGGSSDKAFTTLAQSPHECIHADQKSLDDQQGYPLLPMHLEPWVTPCALSG